MSVNTAHTSNGVLLHAGEFILLYCNHINMQFVGANSAIFSGCKCGRIYLTSHRIIFRNKKAKDDMQSFSAPFVVLSDIKLEQPILAPNYIKGRVHAQPNGNFIEDVTFKIYFRTGGAIEFNRALLRAASIARWYGEQENVKDLPPPYSPPSAWHEAPPPAYQPPKAHTDWLPSHNAFIEPTPNTVFISDNPPPYVGIGEAPPVSLQQPISDNIKDEEQNPDDVLVGCACAALKYAAQNTEES